METNGGFFYVPGASGHRLMLPTKYMDELKNAPEDKADFAASFAEARSKRISRYLAVSLTHLAF